MFSGGSKRNIGKNRVKSGAVKPYTCDNESNVCFMEKKLEAPKKLKNSGYLLRNYIN